MIAFLEVVPASATSLFCILVFLMLQNSVIFEKIQPGIFLVWHVSICIPSEHHF